MWTEFAKQCRTDAQKLFRKLSALYFNIKEEFGGVFFGQLFGKGPLCPASVVPEWLWGDVMVISRECSNNPGSNNGQFYGIPYLPTDSVFIGQFQCLVHLLPFFVFVCLYCRTAIFKTCIANNSIFAQRSDLSAVLVVFRALQRFIF